MNYSVFGSDRRQITILVVSVLTAVALKSGVDSFFGMVKQSEFAPEWNQWILPWAFIVTLIRFAIGSYYHLLSLEPRDKNDKQVGDGIWVLDLFVIGVAELVLLALMGHTFHYSLGDSSASDPTFAVILLTILCLLDAGWVCFTDCFTNRWRGHRSIALIWYGLNSLSGLTLLAFLLFQEMAGLLNVERWPFLLAIGGIFTVAAMVEVGWLLGYRPLKRSS